MNAVRKWAMEVPGQEFSQEREQQGKGPESRESSTGKDGLRGRCDRGRGSQGGTSETSGGGGWTGPTGLVGLRTTVVVFVKDKENHGTVGAPVWH